MHPWTDTEPFHEFWQRLTTPIPPEPPAEPTLWELEKSANRLQRTVAKLESRRWMPTLPYRVSGRAVRELQEAHALLHEAGHVITEGHD